MGSSFSEMLSLQLMLFCLIVIGVVVKKVGIVNVSGRKVLTDLLIDIILPCNIIKSFMGGISISEEFVHNSILMLVISAGVEIIAVYGSKLLFIKFPKEKKSVLSYGMICSNSGFIGLPMAEMMLSDPAGVGYASIYLIPLRFTMWTAGLSLFTNVDKKDAFRKLARHPCILAVFIGILLMVLPLPLPGFLNNTIEGISKCTTPISMIVIGAILADAPVKSLFSPSVLYYAFLRLIAFPIFVYAVLLPFHLDPLVVDVALLMAAMPAGSTTSILADKYGGDVAFSSQIVFTSTLFSIFTIPLMSFLM